MSLPDPIPGVGPAFVGYVDTTVDALRIVRAAVDGIIPRTSRRLTGAERRTVVRSGSVFVFSVIESGIKRWTDGIVWSPSRIRGNFLIYRQLERTETPSGTPSTGDGGRSGVMLEQGMESVTSAVISGGLIFKIGGLIKKTITISLKDMDFHLVAYYKSEDVDAGMLVLPKSSRDLMSLHLSPRDFQLDRLRSPPRIEQGLDGRAFIADDTEDMMTMSSPQPSTSSLGEPERREHGTASHPRHIPIMAPLRLESRTPSLSAESTQERRVEPETRYMRYPSYQHTSSAETASSSPLDSPAQSSSRYPLRPIGEPHHFPVQSPDPRSTTFSSSSHVEGSTLSWNAPSSHDHHYENSLRLTRPQHRRQQMQQPSLRHDFSGHGERVTSGEALMGPGRAVSSGAAEGGFSAGTMRTNAGLVDDSRAVERYTRDEVSTTTTTWYGPYGSSADHMTQGGTLESTASHAAHDSYLHQWSAASARESERTPVLAAPTIDNSAIGAAGSHSASALYPTTHAQAPYHHYSSAHRRGSMGSNRDHAPRDSESSG